MTSFVGKRCLGEKFATAFLFQTKSVSAIIDKKIFTNLTDLEITIMKKLKQGELIFPGVHELEHLWQFEIVM